jgi:NAD(P)H-flavin reductase
MQDTHFNKLALFSRSNVLGGIMNTAKKIMSPLAPTVAAIKEKATNTRVTDFLSHPHAKAILTQGKVAALLEKVALDWSNAHTEVGSAWEARKRGLINKGIRPEKANQMIGGLKNRVKAGVPGAMKFVANVLK